MASLTTNEFLCFLSFHTDKLASDCLYQKLSDFYNEKEAVVAKNILISVFDNVLDPELIKSQRKPRVNGKEPAKDKIVRDILEIWQILDRENAGNIPTQFVAADITRIPSVNAEKYNIQFLVSSILKLQEQAYKQENLNDNILNTLLKINRRLDVEASIETGTALNRSLPLTPIKIVSSKRKNNGRVGHSDDIHNDFHDVDNDDASFNDIVIINPSTGAIAKKNS